jgi:hypothetical protein
MVNQTLNVININISVHGNIDKKLMVSVYIV